ncbi:MAG: type IV secretion system DNA-binding domain-containing protein [Patescibacteria group bacterium]|nr:type IV secretion system DNA-binding domain-containing protein [Patescibacteria group bacterium]MDD5490562.1 type IV secretion system DNA-binding domain-containing protein [Patescibacteria group bacterium]
MLLSFWQTTINLGGSELTLETGEAVSVLDFLLLALLGFFVLFFIIFWIRNFLRQKGQTIYGFKKVVLAVRMPKDLGGEEKKEQAGLQKIQEMIAVAETFFSGIGGLRREKGWKTWFFGRQDQIALEIVVWRGLIYFYVACPLYLRDYLEQQIQAQYPDSVIEEVEDYNIFSPQGVILGTYLTLTRKNAFPIKTYRKLESDPLNTLTNSLSKIDEESGAAIQIVLRPAGVEWRKEGVHIATAMQQGKKLSAVEKKSAWGELGKTFKAAASSGAASKPGLPPKQNEPYRLSPLEEEMVKGLEEKSSKAGMEVNIRVMASAKSREAGKIILDNIVNSFNQYNIYQYGNGFRQSAPSSLKKIIKEFIYRHFNENKKIILNTEEMASIYHFPLPTMETPRIAWLLSRSAPAPNNIPREGLLLGVNTYRGVKTEVRIKREDRRRHLYVIGMTGTGKSWFQEGLAVRDIKNGEGVCFIDPHGDAIEHILERIPRERAEDVIIFDPSDFERPLAMNILEYYSEDQKIFVINELLAIFEKLYDLKATGGPMFEQYMRNALMLIMDDPESGSTLLEVPKVLADEEFRKFKLSKCRTPVVKDFWEKEAQKAGGEASLANMVPYITSKLTPFIANDLVRLIIAQQKSAFNFREAMDSRKIILVNLAKGKIGEINANLLGMIIIGKILMASLGRADIPEEERKDFYLYIDEFQNFLTESVNVILSEARKYRLCLTIGHQYISQLVKNNDTRIRDAIFGNVGTKVCFRIGVEDAEHMVKEFAPIFSVRDFLNIPKYNAYAKLLIDNANPPPFNMATISLDEIARADAELAKNIRELSRLKYGRSRKVVEMEVLERTRVVQKKTREGE